MAQLVYQKYAEKDVQSLFKDDLPVLTYNEKFSICGKNQKCHTYIEGDMMGNLVSLAPKYYAGFDIVEFDIPFYLYNSNKTIASRFINEKQGVDDEDAYCSFVNSRISAAYYLMKNNGVAYITVSDRELANVEKICNNIFGKDGKIRTLIFKTNNADNQNTPDIVENHYYVLLYSKGKNFKPTVPAREVEKRINDFHIGYKIYDPKKDYLIPAPDGTYISAGGDASKRKKRLSGGAKTHDVCWRYDEDGFKALKKQGRILIKKNKKHEWKVYVVHKTDSTKDSIKRNDTIPNTTFKDHVDANTKSVVHRINKTIIDFAEEKSYNFKGRNIESIVHLYDLFPNKSARILNLADDTGQSIEAAHLLNKLDGGKRTVVSLSENPSKKGSYDSMSRNIAMPLVKSLRKNSGFNDTLNYFNCSIAEWGTLYWGMNSNNYKDAWFSMVCFLEDMHKTIDADALEKYPLLSDAIRDGSASLMVQGKKNALVVYDSHTIIANDEDFRVNEILSELERYTDENKHASSVFYFPSHRDVQIKANVRIVNLLTKVPTASTRMITYLKDNASIIRAKQ